MQLSTTADKNGYFLIGIFPENDSSAKKLPDQPLYFNKINLLGLFGIRVTTFSTIIFSGIISIGFWIIKVCIISQVCVHL
jgi:hypothetical protein